MLRHANIQTTMNTYTQAVSDQKRAANEQGRGDGVFWRENSARPAKHSRAPALNAENESSETIPSLNTSSPRSSGRLVQRPLHALCDEGCERLNICVDTGAIQRREIRVPIFNTNHGPGITARRQHRVHQEPRHAAVSIRVRMVIAEQPVPENSADAWIYFLFEHIEERGHGIAHGLPSRWYVPRGPQINCVVAIAGKRSCGDQTRRHAGLKQFAVPVLMSGTNQRAGIGAGDDFCHRCFDKLESLPIATRGQRVAVLAVVVMMCWVPVAALHALDERRRDAVALD